MFLVALVFSFYNLYASFLKKNYHFFLWPFFGFVSWSFANELNMMIYWKMEKGPTSNGRKIFF
jgi:hypothetical protein